jgi:mannose-6-phosphate isomerase-like protein (cupin superfamily)
MNPRDFPAFVRHLPEAELSCKGLRAWLLQGAVGQVLYKEADTEVTMPEHAHGEQWGVVVDGRLELTIVGFTRLYMRGDFYSIPAGKQHRTRVFPGFKAVDHFAEADRYKPKR